MSSRIQVTAHGALRMAQRGVAAKDIALATLIGTEVEGGFLVREKDYQAYEREVKRELVHARRLAGKRVVIARDQIVTAYHAIESKQQRLLRGARDSGGM